MRELRPVTIVHRGPWRLQHFRRKVRAHRQLVQNREQEFRLDALGVGRRHAGYSGEFC